MQHSAICQPERIRYPSVGGSYHLRKQRVLGRSNNIMVPPSSESEPSVLMQIAAGDRDAVALCIDRFGGLVWSLARKFCHNTSDAEDAVQEVFTEIWRSAARFDPGIASEATFISTIARRRLIDRQRKAGRTVKSEPLTAASDMGRAVGIEPAELNDEVQRAKQALSTLSEEQQNALQLSIYEGYSHGEIAKRMDVPLGTVKTNIRRGLMRLRSMLADDDNEDGAGGES